MLEHYAYCPRQCALIHLEQTYTENVYTIRGNLLHRRVDEGISTIENGIRIERSMPLWSEKLGIRGIADVVEFHGKQPYPVEYKPGKRMAGFFRTAADIQLCAQSLCLEEMLNIHVPRGAVFFKKSQRRREVIFTSALREETMKTIGNVREMLVTRAIPPPLHDKHCDNCSLIDSCLPGLADRERMAMISANLFGTEE